MQKKISQSEHTPSPVKSNSPAKANSEEYLESNPLPKVSRIEPDFRYLLRHRPHLSGGADCFCGAGRASSDDDDEEGDEGEPDEEEKKQLYKSVKGYFQKVFKKKGYEEKFKPSRHSSPVKGEMPPFGIQCDPRDYEPTELSVRMAGYTEGVSDDFEQLYEEPDYEHMYDHLNVPVESWYNEPAIRDMPSVGAEYRKEYKETFGISYDSYPESMMPISDSMKKRMAESGEDMESDVMDRAMAVLDNVQEARRSLIAEVANMAGPADILG